MSEPLYAAVTIASKRYFALARVTAQSFLEHHREIPFFVLLADLAVEQALQEQELFSVIHLEDLPLPEPERFCFRYTELEFSYALTPYVITYLLSQGFDGVLFLKQETLVLDDLKPMLSQLAHATALVTPHFLEPPQRSDALTWEINVLRSGVFNGGVLAFTNGRESRRFLDWWQRRTLEQCVLDVNNGIHYEQRWLDFLPSLMPNWAAVRDPGVNVGHWNLPDRQIRIVDDQVTAKGEPCRVFRFSGYDPDTPGQVTKHNNDYAVAETGDAALVFEQYQARLMSAGHETARHATYAFAGYDNGCPITDDERRVYRQLGAQAARFGNPFESGSCDSFYCCAGPWYISWFRKVKNYLRRLLKLERS